MNILDAIKENDNYTMRKIIKFLKEDRESYINTLLTDWAHIKWELESWDRSHTLVDFLLCIYYWSNLIEGSKEHWSGLVYLLYNDIPRQKGRHKRFPPKKNIYKCIRGPFTDEDFLNNRVNHGVKECEGYKELPEFIVEQKSLNFCDKYIWWLCEKLSIYGKVEEKEVKEKINNLLMDIDEATTNSRW